MEAAVEAAAAAAAAVEAAEDPVLETSVIINDVSAHYPSCFRNPRVHIRFHVHDAGEHKCVHPDGICFFRLDYRRLIRYYSH